MSVLITSVLNCASDRLAICSLLGCIYSGFLKCSVIWAIFFLSWHVCYLRCSPGWGNTGHCAVTLYVGEGPRGRNGTRSTLCWILITPSATHNQIGPLWCWFPSKWACAHSRTLWVSPMTSPVRLGVSPVAAPTSMGVITQRFEALFPRAGALVYVVCFAPAICPGLSMCECGAAGSATHHTACPVLRHSESSPLGLSARMWSQRVC